MLYEVMKYCRNVFPIPEKALSGTFTIEGGELSLPFYAGQFFIVEGSAFNDGVHQLPAVLIDETFEGRITPLRVPLDFLKLCEEIKDFNEKHQATPFESESFGGYTYKAATNADGNPVTWRDVFAEKLKVWRKL